MKHTSFISKENRALLAELVRTDFKLRYQDSAIGFIWSLLKPLLMFTILYFVFGKLLRAGQGVPHYPVYLLLGIVLWNFFLESTSQGLGAIVARGDLIRKINFPKYIIVISGTIAALINLGLNLVVIAVFMLVNKVPLMATAPLSILLIVELYVLSLFIAFFLAAANVKYRDTAYIWEVLMQAAFYATPILYPVSLLIGLAGSIGKMLMLNPVAQAIQDARYLLVTHQSDTTWRVFSHHLWAAAVPLVLVVIVGWVAITYFRKNAKYFAENV